MKRLPKNYLGFLFLLCCFVLTISHAEEITLRKALGGAVDIIEHHTRPEVAKLKLISAKASHRDTLEKSDWISGYPITGKLKTLDKVKSQQLANLILDKKNYAYDILQRCENHSLYGIRFTKGLQKVEIALGMPCKQAIVTFKDKEKVKWWGEVLSDEATQQVLALLAE